MVTTGATDFWLYSEVSRGRGAAFLFEKDLPYSLCLVILDVVYGATTRPTVASSPTRAYSSWLGSER